MSQLNFSIPRRTKTDYSVGIFGHYGNRNLGDEALIEAVIQNLRARCPTVRVTGFSLKPEDTTRRHQIPAYPIRRLDGPTPANEASVANRSSLTSVRDFLKRFALLRPLVHAMGFVVRLPRVVWDEIVFLRDSYNVATDLDALLISGSNQIMDDWGGVWRFPYTLLKWTVLARLAGARVIFLSVGAGPIDSVWSRITLRTALSLADYVSFRDAASHRLLDWFGSGGRWLVYPDLAHSLLFEHHAMTNQVSRPVVGINPMPVYDERYWPRPDEARYACYVGRMARFASQLMREGYPIFFFPTQPRDEAVIADVLARLDGDLDNTALDRVRRSDTVAGLIQVIQSADIIVATRFHGALLALHAHRPVVSICYYRKSRDLLREMGQEAYAVDLDKIEDGDLWLVFQALAANRHAEVPRLKSREEEARALLAEQYDSVLKILGVQTVQTAHEGSSHEAQLELSRLAG